MSIRDKIWSLLCNAKFKEYCLSYKVELFQIHDRNINLFLAIASSGSIAGWVIWEKLYFVWAFIIALSQLVNVIKPYFPFHKYVKELTAKVIKMENLNIEFERLWIQVQGDKISDQEAEDVYFKLKTQLVEIQRFKSDTVFRVGKKIEEKANKRMVTFLKSTYDVELNLDTNGQG